MNKLNTVHTGLKVPFNWDDLGWMQSSLSDAIKGILTGLVPAGSLGFKLSGCSVSIFGGIYTVSEGWIFFNNEVIYVPGNSTTPIAGESVYFSTEESAEANGLKVGYDNLNIAYNVSLYKIRIGKLVSGISGVSEMFHSAPYFTDIISDQIGWKNIIANLNTVNTSYSPIFLANQSITNIVHASNYKQTAKTLSLNVNINCDVPGANPDYYDIKLPNSLRCNSIFKSIGLLANTSGLETYICRVYVSPVDDSYIRFSVINHDMSHSNINISGQFMINTV
jgi:hypothetical protein